MAIAFAVRKGGEALLRFARRPDFGTGWFGGAGASVTRLVGARTGALDVVGGVGRDAPEGDAGAGDAETPLFPLFRTPSTAVCPATLIAELGDVRERYLTEAALAADAGMSPVAVESGKRRVAVFRRACDKRLRGAIAVLANSTRQWHP